MPIIRPIPVTDSTSGISFSFSAIYLPLSATCDKKIGSAAFFSTSIAPAQAIGFPPNVDPCVPGVSTPAHLSPLRHAPIGIPPAMPFASVIISAFFPKLSPARNLPVLPTPVCTSSEIVSTSRSAQSSNIASTNFCSSGTTPPSPCIYSNITAHTVSSSFALRSSILFASTFINPSTNGKK